MPPEVDNDAAHRPSGSTYLILGSVLVVVGELLFDYPTWLRDLIRTADLLLSVFIVVTVTAIVRRYGQNYKKDPSKARLLPRHVVRLGIGTLLLTVGASAWTIALLAKPFVWYATPLICPALTTLAAGLWDMLVWLPTRAVAPGSVSNVRFHQALQEMEVKNDA